MKFCSKYRVLARVTGRNMPNAILVVSENKPFLKILIMLAADTVGPTNVSMNFLASLSATIVL